MIIRISILYTLIVVSTLTALAQTEQPTDSRITNVTVFLQHAQITREVTTRTGSGKTNLILSGLSAHLDPKSIQVTGKGDIVILGISHRQNFLTEIKMPKSLKQIYDSVTRVQRLLTLEESQKEILAKEEQMLTSNQKIGGTTQNLTVAEVKSMADFYRARLSEIATMKMEKNEKTEALLELKNKLNRRAVAQSELLTRNTSEIVVTISAQNPTTVSIDVSYIVANAGWNPVYDLRAKNTYSPLQLNYKANVFQSTGEEWTNVKLKLSTANPTQSGLKPELDAWYLSFERPLNNVGTIYRYAIADSVLPGRMAGVSVRSAYSSEKKKEAASLDDYVSIVQTSLTTEFEIDLPYSVSSLAAPVLVDIRNYDVKGEYAYVVTPKLDRDVFLSVKATGWEEYSLLPGEANIFFEGTFVGKTFIAPGNTRDTLSVSLGRDKRISVKREKSKEMTSRKMIGGNQKESVAWEITIRNNKAEAISITTDDQIPVSQNNPIEVTVTETGGAEYDKDSGKLSWNLKLQPNETKKLVFKYEVKYPKHKFVSGL